MYRDVITSSSHPGAQTFIPATYLNIDVKKKALKSLLPRYTENVSRYSACNVQSRFSNDLLDPPIENKHTFDSVAGYV